MAAIWTAANAGASRAAELLLKDGRLLRGKMGEVSELCETPTTQKRGGDNAPLVTFLDDNLRRTYFSTRLIKEVRPEENRPLEEKFTIWQHAKHGGGLVVKSVGLPVAIGEFDEFGRRNFTMVTERGTLTVTQGITELTPQWAKVEATSHIWDMRIATSSIPRDTLQKILWKQIDLANAKLNKIDPTKAEGYKKIARFYLQSERYSEARAVLNALLEASPDRDELKEQLAPSLEAIKQLQAQQVVHELQFRHNAGQHQFVSRLLRQFPSEGVNGETLQIVRDMLQEHDTREARRRAVAGSLKALAGRIPNLIAKENLKPILTEIAAEISPDTLDRMAAFLQNADDQQTPDSEKLALAVSGWLLGADAATAKLPLAISAYRVRGFLRQYLGGRPAPEREQIYGYIKAELAGDPETVAGLLAHMKPPLPLPEPAAGRPGYYELQAPSLAKEQPVTYFIQLPPEYDPYRLYPAIVTLSAEMTTAQQQIDWWAGPAVKGGSRAGQATRQGYIVIAPVWIVERQDEYGYSAREHAAVLNSLRDACRRFSVDTDRVFLSGHSIGGDAAWDIGLAHPDLWAGVIPVVATADRYCDRYWKNARYVPFYVVAGGLDDGRLAKDSLSLDRYLRYGFNTTVVEFLGRGHEDFYEEILRIFDWMGRFRRNFYPRDFTCETMREWDNFFWWVEVSGLPRRSRVDPADWPPASGTQPVKVHGSVTSKNGLNVQAGASEVTVWLSPKLIDFHQRASILVNGRRLNNGDQKVKPDLRVLLEDVRTRGDRQHPFWAALQGSTGRVRSEE